MRHTARLLALALPLVALVATGCTSDGEAEAATSEPFVPVSRAVETEAGVLVVATNYEDIDEVSAVILHADTLQPIGESMPRVVHGGPLDPSGTFLAARIRSGGRPIGDLDVYDTQTGRLAWSLPDLPNGEMTWHAGGLYVWADHCEFGGASGSCLGSWQRGLYRINPDGIDEIVEFDFAPVPSPAIVNSDGTRGYVLGMETDRCCGMGNATPFLAILDLVGGSVATRIQLPDLRLGQPGDWLGSTDHGFGGRYLPGLAASPDESTAYVVHAETDEVTTIDLETRTVAATHSFEEDDSAVTRLGEWLLDRFAHSAEAKGVAEYIRDVQLSPDGRYLIVSGTTTLETPEEVPPGGWVEPTAGGMFIVDLASMEVVYRDETTQDFTLSPNGYSLMGWGRLTSLATPVGLTLIDLRSLSVTTMFAGEPVGPAFASPDGVLGYVRVREYMSQQSGRLVAFDLETGEVSAERELEQRGQMQWDLPRGLEFSP